MPPAISHHVRNRKVLCKLLLGSKLIFTVFLHIILPICSFVDCREKQPRAFNYTEAIENKECRLLAPCRAGTRPQTKLLFFQLEYYFNYVNIILVLG